jgi:cell division protein FtsW
MQVQKHQMDYVLFFTVIVLSVIGVLTVFSASTVIALQSNPPLPASFYAKKQLISGILGIALLIVLSQISHRTWYRFAVIAMFVNLFLLTIVLIPGIGVKTNGGRRWLAHGSFHLQPSELALVATIMYLAFFFTKKISVLHNFKRGLIPALVMTGINFLLIFAEPDMGTGLTLLGTAIVLIFASGARLKPLLLFVGSLLPVLIGLTFLASYRSSRIAAWLHPFKHAGSISYQLVQGMTAISAGGWFGRGFDMSIEKAGYLPYPQTDFIFPVFVEEWGLVGAIALLVAFGVLIWRGFRIARHSSDRFGALLAVGLTGMITVNAVINLGAVTGLLPVTGIPLPFISYGGTALIINMMAMGILLSVSRYTLDEEPEADQYADVIAADEVEQFREKRVELPKRVRQPQRLAEGRRPGRVESFHTQGNRSESRAPSNWRARQEIAAGRSESRKVQNMTRKSTNAPSWRERNSNWNGTADTRSKKRKNSFKRGR